MWYYWIITGGHDRLSGQAIQKKIQPCRLVCPAGRQLLNKGKGRKVDWRLFAKVRKASKKGARGDQETSVRRLTEGQRTNRSKRSKRKAQSITRRNGIFSPARVTGPAYRSAWVYVRSANGVKCVVKKHERGTVCLVPATGFKSTLFTHTIRKGKGTENIPIVGGKTEYLWAKGSRDQNIYIKKYVGQLEMIRERT